MSKNNNENFFEDLDKTTDLLRSFKPHGYEESKTESLDTLYKEYQKLAEEEEIMTRQTRRKFSELSKEEKKEILANLSPEQKEMLKRKKAAKLAQRENKNKKTDLGSIVKKINTDLKNDDIKKPKKVEKVEVEKEEKVKPVKEEKKEVKNSGKKRKLKDGVPQLAFISLSILFIIGCCIFYGSRLLHYYRIYNPKGENGKALSLLTVSLGKNSSFVTEGEGLYMLNGDYVFKGKNVDNYIKYSNLTWRIIKTNSDGSIDIVLDEPINTLMWNSEITNYTNSDINEYLNTKFLNILNKDLLVKTTICKDKVEDLKSFSCNGTDNSKYVRLLNISEFLNSKVEDSGTYISSDEDTMWLSTAGSKLVWQINGTNVSSAEPNRALSIKPVVTLKAGVAILEGKGTEKEPYIIEKDSKELKVGDYVTLGTDKWIVYEVNKDTIKLTTDSVLSKTYRFDLNKTTYSIDTNNSLGYYLNNTYLNSLSYKDLIKESEWNVGNYELSYKDIEKDKIKAKVGLLSVTDFKFNTETQDYYLLNGNPTGVYLYSNELITSKVAIYRNIRPAISIKKGKVASGNGSSDKPYIMEG